MDRQTVFDYIKRKYGTEPEYPWRKNPDHAVFRHKDNGKWFALEAGISGDKVGAPDAEYVDVINLKVADRFFRDMIIREEGIMPAFHMNKLHWASAKKKEKFRPPKEWIIPANPKYFDIVKAFDETDTIDWKQGAGIKKGDTVFMYVAAPVSAVLYKCRVLETDIPYEHENKYITIKALMRIRLLKRYAPDRFTFETLKEEYGIYAVRGPRGIPNSLSAALRK